jgi:transcriptional regulator NrdR family protein
MNCLRCKTKTKVVNTRLLESGIEIKRRRVCPKCGYKFTTHEYVDRKYSAGDQN